MADPLGIFDPVVSSWFRRQVGKPTAVQRLAWPVIAGGGHALITAPTGSGKTLAAFLGSLDRLLTGALSGGGVRVVYISPLRALNNDIRRNLLAPLAGLREAFDEAGRKTPELEVMTRSGDTTPAERRRMLKHPPEILITTPESLNILLTSKGGRSILDGVATVILDEVHAVAGSKRGTHLITAVERLTLLSGEFQRLALSATVRPLERIARFVGGYEIEPVDGAEPRYRPRKVNVIEAPRDKRYELKVGSPVAEARSRAAKRDLEHAPPPGSPGGGGPEGDRVAPPGGDGSISERLRMDDSAWDLLAADVRRSVHRNRSTLIFANSRRMTEKLTRLVNREVDEDLVYSHHGSLSREVRGVVEKRLKDGRLSGIVATNSLELGIDIGSLDEVLMVQTPRSVSSALQRLGRAGHNVGDVSRGRIYPTFGRDLVSAAVVARAVLEGEIEELRPVSRPLDVLAQVILSMTVAEVWDVDDLFRFLRSISPYRELRRKEYDLVLEMLAGRYADSRIRELRPRVAIDRVDNTVRARPGAARLVYMAGGTIPDRGYYQLRMEESGARLGELDEEFVWERSVGDTFTLGAQSWRIRAITHNDVVVRPSRTGAAMAPFWRADARDRDFALSQRVGRFLAALDGRLEAGEPPATTLEWLGEEYAMEPAAAEVLVELAAAQRAATGGSLPHHRHLVVETCRDDRDGVKRRRTILHTTWGGKVNRPLAIALSAAWEKRFGHPLEVTHDDDCLILNAPEEVDPEELLEMVSPDELEGLLRERLAQTGFFGAHFRINSGTALLLPRADFKRRQPLWLTRAKAKQLLENVARYEDFPIVLETWRSCLEDDLDLPSLRQVLDELQRGEIPWTAVKTSQPSPFAGDVIWRETNRLMYEDDRPEGGRGATLSDELLRELVFASELRPRIPQAIVDELAAKLHRTAPGYPPSSPEELLEWVKERILIPEDEWARLLEAVARDVGEEEVEGWREGLAEKLVRVDLSGARPRAVMAIESVPRMARALGVSWTELGCAGLGEIGGPGEIGGIGDLGEASKAAGEAAAPLSETPLSKTLRQTIAGLTTEFEAGTESEPLLSDLVGEWLRHYGPVSHSRLTEVWGLSQERLRIVLEELTEERRIVIDQIREPVAEGSAVELEICDSENLERLLRRMRFAARPIFEALPLSVLPQFLATHQGITGGADAGPESLQSALDHLFGYPASVKAWEGEILPARLAPYYPAWLDALVWDSDLLWLGCGRERATFLFGEDLPLVTDDDRPESDPAAVELFPDPRMKLSFTDLSARSGLDSAELTETLWRLAWQGEISNSAFATVRRAALNRFRAVPAAPEGGSRGELPPAGPRRRSFRRGFDRWKAAQPSGGDWFRIERPSFEELDALDREEWVKERVRLLMARYGVLFRELTQRELRTLSWGRVFRSLRLMELSGEILAGHFFAGVPGPQFISHGAFRRLREGLDSDVIYWLSAVDPASPAGLDLEEFQGRFPSRLPGNHIVFHGSEPVVISKRQGGEIEFSVPPEHPHLIDYLVFLEHLLTRGFAPLRVIEVETINGERASASPFASRLAERFNVSREYKSVKLRRSYSTES